MKVVARGWLILSGLLCAAGALLHLAIPLGGPAWYRAAGAPAGLVRMAEDGLARPVISCVVIAGVLFIFAACAFSALGWVRRLPATRALLALIGLGLGARALAFPLLALAHAASLTRWCGRCGSLNAFVIATSVLCLVIGIGFLLAAAAGVAPTRRQRRPPRGGNMLSGG